MHKPEPRETDNMGTRYGVHNRPPRFWTSRFRPLMINSIDFYTTSHEATRRPMRLFEGILGIPDTRRRSKRGVQGVQPPSFDSSSKCQRNALPNDLQCFIIFQGQLAIWQNIHNITIHENKTLKFSSAFWRLMWQFFGRNLMLITLWFKIVYTHHRRWLISNREME